MKYLLSPKLFLDALYLVASLKNQILNLAKVLDVVLSFQNLELTSAAQVNRG